MTQPYAYGPQEPPTNPGTPGAKAVAQEVEQAAVQIRAGGFAASIPAAVLVALVTAGTTAGAVRASAPEASNTKELSEIRATLDAVRKDQRDLIEKVSADASKAETARNVDAVQQASIKLRLDTLESRIR